MEGRFDNIIPLKGHAAAGRQLAARVSASRDQAPIVPVLPRGGIAVADEITERLHASLGLVPVRKLATPFQADFVIGTIASYGGRWGEAILYLETPAYPYAVGPFSNDCRQLEDGDVIRLLDGVDGRCAEVP
ncbi:hypothetical protein [Azospirillum endophyticum]